MRCLFQLKFLVIYRGQNSKTNNNKDKHSIHRTFDYIFTVNQASFNVYDCMKCQNSRCLLVSSSNRFRRLLPSLSDDTENANYIELIKNISTSLYWTGPSRSQ
ncbi:hypothetical protein AB6A40_002864 [Gnathostoma spinigerum]|uniref:Uncharacterized protein n=1 Tax=Gnathostoma spinigerum TaxID=75299 RepID=A0ABD6EIM7_9BILA